MGGSSAVRKLYRTGGRGWGGPKWHSPNSSMPFHRAQKSLDFQGPTPSHLPSQWICTYQKHYVWGCINHWCINSYNPSKPSASATMYGSRLYTLHGDPVSRIIPSSATSNNNGATYLFRQSDTRIFRECQRAEIWREDGERGGRRR